jgi:hypothetical protein
VSFSERMQSVRTADELDELMMEVRRSGSPNWTLGAARAKVRSHLWEDLDPHFDGEGRLLPAGAMPPVERTAPARGEERPTQGTGGIVALITRLNVRLAAVRQGNHPVRGEEAPIMSALSGMTHGMPRVDADPEEADVALEQAEIAYVQREEPETRARHEPPRHQKRRSLDFMGSIALKPVTAVKALLRWHFLSGSDDPRIYDPLNGIIESMVAQRELEEQQIARLAELWGEAITSGFNPENPNLVKMLS